MSELEPAHRKSPSNELWVVEWFVSESFWRDVASRALSGLIVATAVGLVALLAGIIPKDATVFVVGVPAMFGSAFAFGGVSSAVRRRLNPKRKYSGVATAGSVLIIYGLLILGLLLLDFLGVIDLSALF